MFYMLKQQRAPNVVLHLLIRQMKVKSKIPPLSRFQHISKASRMGSPVQGRAQELAEGGLRQISNGTPIKNIPRHRTASGFTLPHSLGGSVSSQANQPQ